MPWPRRTRRPRQRQRDPDTARSRWLRVCWPCFWGPRSSLFTSSNCHGRDGGCGLFAGTAAVHRGPAVRQSDGRCLTGVLLQRHHPGPDHRPVQGSGLLVVARESAFAYKDSAESSGRIGRELGARFLLRGSLRREGQQLRLNVRFDTRDERALWANATTASSPTSPVSKMSWQPRSSPRWRSSWPLRIDGAWRATMRPVSRPTTNSCVASTITDAAPSRTTRSPRATTSGPSSWTRGTARAFAALALTHVRDAVDGWATTTQGSMDRAEELVEQAMKLDPGCRRSTSSADRSPCIGVIMPGRSARSRRPSRCLQAMPTPMRCSPGCCTLAGRPTEGLGAMERCSTAERRAAINLPAGTGRDSLCSRRRCARRG